MICRAFLTALLHHTYILSYPYPLEIYLGHAPRTCTLDMYLGHAPWTCTLDATCHTLCHPGACMPHLGPVPWSPTLDPRTPLDPHCLEMPARKGKGAVGWAGLGAGRAPVSRWALRRVLTTAAGWQSRVPSAATPGGACPAPSPGLSRLAVPMQPSYRWRKTPPSRACPAPRRGPRVAGTVSYHMTHHVVNFCSVLPCMGLWLPALSCLCVLSQALMGYQPSGCFLLLCLA